MRWDPREYLRFGDDRGRPFHDLIARVGANSPAYVVDLGCGPGNLTRDLCRRWPGAAVEGVDSSGEMIDQARASGPLAVADADPAHVIAGRPIFTHADLRTWAPHRPVDVLVSNATLQWVPDHLHLLDRLIGLLAPQGWMALQVPGNFGEPSHTELAAVRALPRWRERLDALDLPEPWVAEPAAYLAWLAAPGRDVDLTVDVWETTYLQVLEGPDAVLHWVRGTALRPVLTVLDEAEQADFLADCGERLRLAYPRRAYGTVLPYRRIFVLAQRS